MLAAAAPASVSESRKATFQQLVESQLSKSTLSQAHWGIMVQDLESGDEIIALNADKLFMPASTRKLFTSALALDALGSDYRFSTRFESHGRLSLSGTLKGDLVVRASGDPTISGRFRADKNPSAVFSQWARDAAELGFKRVSGNLIIDTSLFDETCVLGEGWSWENESDYYAAPVGAFSYNENMAAVSARAGASIGAPCEVSVHPVEFFEIDNRSRTVAEGVSTVQMTRERNSNRVVVSGDLPRGAKTEWRSLSVNDPDRFAGESLLAELNELGIEVDGGALVDPKFEPKAGTDIELISEYQSPPLSEMLVEVNRASNNHLAEMIYLAAGRKLIGGPASFKQSREAEQIFWKKIQLPNAHRLYSADGSGLSRRNLATPDAFCHLLRKMCGHRDSEVFLDSLAVNGKNGTLEGRLGTKHYYKRVHAKTGHIANVSCLAGYLKDETGRMLVFSIMVNNFTCSKETMKAAQDKICKWLIDLPSL
jgi:D-alanyl-D-alanine carboxypeptidase/D-alanyl-D-alanine-endopeptidase (penicillin-binding protein 4)